MAFPAEAGEGVPAPPTLALLDPINLHNRTPDHELGEFLRKAFAASGEWRVIPRDTVAARFREYRMDVSMACHEFQCSFDAGNVLAAALDMRKSNLAPTDSGMFALGGRMGISHLVYMRDTTVKVGAKAVILGPAMTWTPSNAHEKSWWIEWVGAENKAVLTFPTTWNFDAVGPGTARIAVVSAQNSAVRDTLTVTVVQPVDSLKAANHSMKAGDADYAPSITWYPSNASN